MEPVQTGYQGDKVVPDTSIPVPRFQQAMLNKVTDTIWCHDLAEIQGIPSTMDAGY